MHAVITQAGRVNHADWPSTVQSRQRASSVIAAEVASTQAVSTLGHSSIADGLALGLISYPLVKLLSGRRRDVSLLMLVLAALLIAYFVLLRSQLAA